MDKGEGEVEGWLGASPGHATSFRPCIPAAMLAILLKLLLLCAAISFSGAGMLSQSNTTKTMSAKDWALEEDLVDKCFNNIFLGEWWSFVWCHKSGVRQIHYNHQTKQIEVENNLGDFVEEESQIDHQIYRGTVADCPSEKSGAVELRYTEVAIECCEETGRHVPHKDAAAQAGGTVIAVVSEPVPCTYYMVVCARSACNSETLAAAELQRAQVERALEKAEAEQRILRDVHLQRQREAHIQHQRALKEGNVMHSGQVEFEVSAAGSLTGDTSAAASVASAAATASGSAPGSPTPGEHGGKAEDGSSSSSSNQPPPFDLVFLDDWRANSPYQESPLEYDIPSAEDQLVIRNRVKNMFIRAYDDYMENAFPAAELKPVSCIGGPFELVKIPMVTLIDAMDTLVVMGNYTEFRRAVRLVGDHYMVGKFDIDVNVSVFETTIRVLGGLLGAHLMAVDEKIGIYNATATSEVYDGCLLTLAIDLGDRLLPAFKTNTGIPFGTVNLRSGVPRGETEIASTAGAGTLLVEFEVLSSLSQNRAYGDAAYAALAGLFNRRSSIGLLGKHIHTDTGAWFESVSGIGSNSDSFYEYLLKAYLLFRNKDLYRMFTSTYVAVKRYVQVGDWFGDVDMFNGKLRRHRTENLHAFWPGMEATLGFSYSGARTLNTLYSVWSDLGFLPEELDNMQWLAGKSAGMHGYYPLRPELIESTYLQYRTTGDRSWLVAGELFLDSLEQRTRAVCGYASVGNVETGELKDEMPSFFLSETLKYLYLLFDENNFVHDRAYIFSTEAHLFDPTQLPPVQRTPPKAFNITGEQGQAGAAAESGSSHSRAQKSAAAPAQAQPSSSSSSGSSSSSSGSSSGAQAPAAGKPSFIVTTTWQDNHYTDDGDLVDETNRASVLAKAAKRDPHPPRGGKGATSLSEIGTNFAKGSKVAQKGPDLLPSRCSKKVWWDSHDGYVLGSITPQVEEALPSAAGARVPPRESDADKGMKKFQAIMSSMHRRDAQRQRLRLSRRSADLDMCSGCTAAAGQNSDSKSLAAAGTGSGFLDQQQRQQQPKHIQKSTSVPASVPSSAGGTVSASDLGRNRPPAAARSAKSPPLTGWSILSTLFGRILRLGYNPNGDVLGASKSLLIPAIYPGGDISAKLAPDAHVHSQYVRAIDREVTQYRRMTRITNSMHNIERMLKQLAVREARGATSTQSESASKESGRLEMEGLTSSAPVAPARRPLTCYPEDEPVMKGHQDAIQTVEANMGPLGDFTVHVYSDGFVVHSRNFGNTLEISNVGQPIMFARDFNATSSRTVVGKLSGEVVTCSVSVYSGEASAPINSDGAVPIFERSCTAAAFGPSSVPLPISGRLQSKFYRPPTKNPRSVEEDTASAPKPNIDLDYLCGKGGEAPTSASAEQGAASSWWDELWGDTKPAPAAVPSPASKGLPRSNNAPTSPPSTGSRNAAPAPAAAAVAASPEDLDLKGRVALARRGQCMFEEKADAAGKAGAVALIVVNDEDSLFVMSGRTTPAAAAATAGEQAPPTDTANETVDNSSGPSSSSMPTVMITDKDGEDLVRVLSDYAETHLGDLAPVVVRVSATPMMLDSAWMGAFDYPKVRMKKHVVHVLSSKGWGAILSSSTGLEWQLYIMSGSDMTAVNVWPTTVLTQGNQQITTTAALALNPLELYARTLSRTCPDYVCHDEFGLFERLDEANAAPASPSAPSAQKPIPINLKLVRKGQY